MRRRVLATVLGVATLCTAGCTSSAHRSAHTPSSRASVAPTSGAAPAKASSPQQAALGFEASVESDANTLRYDCIRSFRWVQNDPLPKRANPLRAVAHKSGQHWIVTVGEHPATSGTRWQVSHRDGGYCVSKQLRPR